MPVGGAMGSYAGTGGAAMSKGCGKVVFDKTMLVSPVWLSLSGIADKVYCLFRCRCVYGRIGGKRGNRTYEHINNGKLEFTYIEAKEKYGIKAGRFVRAIDELVEKGFLDVTEPGGGVHKFKTLYGISERWRNYGTDSFQQIHRPERRFKCGFCKGNRLWQKKKSTVENAHGLSVSMQENAHGSILAMRTNAHGEKVKNQYNFSNGRYLCLQIA
jgi:DNA-binding PadR family transcriptional regulator